MPIKFRCQHCQQFLGISRSRAGAVVDCPQCGRDLRVPELDGRTRRMPDAGTATRTDSALMSALSELSVLDQSDDSPVALATPQTAAADRSVVAEASQQVEVSVEPLPVPDPVELDAAGESPVVDALPAVIPEYDGSTVASLAELATLHPHQSEVAVSDSLLDEMRSVSHPVGVSIASVIAGTLLLLMGLVTGWYFGRARDRADLTVPVARQPHGAAADVSGPPPAVAADTMIVSGRVQYPESSGQMVPDSGATIIVLPGQRNGSVRLNARSLQLPADHPDHRATLAALATYGGALTLADDRSILYEYE